METACILKNRKIAISQPRVDRFLPNLARWRSSIFLSRLTVKNFNFLESKMAAAAISKNRKIAISWQRLDLSPRNLARWRSLTLLTIPTAATSMQPICAIMNFSTDSLERVGCCTSVVLFHFCFWLSICVIWAICLWLLVYALEVSCSFSKKFAV